MQYDVFISHASEDKDKLVRQLSGRLVKLGCKVWYDELSLRVGDSLSRSIDYGLSQSNFGLVVLSQAFLSKAWPEYELRGLVTKEIGGSKVILPIIHGVDIKDVAKYSLTLADKVALDSSKLSLDELTVKILEVVRPDIFSNLIKTIIAETLSSETNRDYFDILQEINPRTAIPAKLSSCQIVRLRIIYGLFHPFMSQVGLKKWLNSVSHQEDPELELLWWENLSVLFMDFARYKRVINSTEKLHLLFNYLVALLHKQKFNRQGEVDAWLSKVDPNR